MPTSTNRPTPIIEVDFINDPTSAVDTWTNITPYCRAQGVDTVLLSTARGRDYELSRVATGTFAMVLDNTDGRFDPNNPASPYATGAANPGGAAGIITPGRKIRVRATWLGTTYPIFRGYVDNWPQEWSNAGFFGVANTNGTDGFAPLAQIDLPALYVNEVLKDSPIGFYRLNDSQGSVSAANSSAINQPLSQIVPAGTPQVADTFAFGSDGGSGLLAGDPSTSLNLHSGSWNGTYNPSGYALRTADYGVGPLLTLPGGFSLDCWIKTSNVTQQGVQPTGAGVIFSQSSAAGEVQAQLYVSNVGGVLEATFGVFPRAFGANIAQAGPIAIQLGDGQWHHIACTFAADGITPNMRIDGVTATVFAASAPIAWDASVRNQWGSEPLGSQAYCFDGSIKNLGLYNTALTPTRLNAHTRAGGGWPGDTTGVRQGRILDAAGWPTGLRALSAGNTAQGYQSTEGTKALEALQTVADTEVAPVYVDRAGNVTQPARQARYNGSSTAAFGEQAGEFHYLGDLLVQQDNREVYNDVTVSRVNGVTVRDQDSASQLRYFPRSLQLSSTANTDADTVYLAQWLLAKYKTPLTRIPQISLDPVTQPGLWPFLLGAEIGTQITVTRRPGAAARTISADFFIEKITHTISGKTWTIALLLSPASIAAVLQVGSSTHIGGGAALLNAVTTATTTFLVDNGGDPNNRYSLTDVPYLATVDAEQVNVTAVTPAASDAFGRTVANGWGTADIGGAWTTLGGSASDYSVGGGQGQITLPTLGTVRIVYLASPATDLDITCDIGVSQVSAGSSIIGGIVFRDQTANGQNLWHARVVFTPAAVVNLQLSRVITGTETVTVTIPTTIAYAANQMLRMRVSAVGALIRVKVWDPAAGAEPFIYQLIGGDISFGGVVGRIGTRTSQPAGGTNTNPVVLYDNFTVNGPQALTVTRAAASTVAAAHSAGAVVNVNAYPIPY